MKCFQKVGGGSHRFSNRIIKSGQKFWIYPESLASFKDFFKEVPNDDNAVVITTAVRPKIEGKKALEIVPEKFKMVKALDEAGEPITKGKSNLYNVIGVDEKPLNEKPLRKAKADELLKALNA